MKKAITIAIILIFSLLWYVDMDYSNGVVRKYSKRITFEEATSKLKSVSTEYQYYSKTTISFIRVKTKIPFVFKKKNYSKYVSYESSKK